MSERAGRALVAPLARKRTKLEAKGKVRSHKKIAKRLPAGSADLASVPKGKDYVGGKKKSGGGIEQYCKAVRKTQFLARICRLVIDQNPSNAS